MAGEETNQQQSNISQEFNTATGGLNMDSSISQIPKGSLTFALNAAVENFADTSINYQNELGNKKCLDFPEDYQLIGEHSIIEKNKHIFFLSNPLTGDSEIGYMDNNNCIYHTLINAKCLNFNIHFPIQKVVHKITNCSTEIYWTDGNNVRRYLNIDKVPYKLSPSSDLCDKRYTTELDCNKLSLQPDFSIPELEIIDVITGGELIAGTYQFAIQYGDAGGNGYSSYYSVTNPTPIANPHITSINFNYPVGKSIEIKISNLDVSGQWQYFNLAVIKTINDISSVELVGTYFIDKQEKTIIYTGQNVTQIKLSISDVFEKFPYYDVAQDLTTVQDILIWDKLTSIDRINLQQIANEITLQWQSYRIPNTEDYSNEVNATNLRGYLRDEVYAFEIVFLLRNGKQLDGFHIPGRAANTNDLAPIPNTNADFIGQPTYTIGTIGYSPYWKIYNSATVEGISTGYSTDPSYKGNYQYGNFSYWESTELYPCNTEVWGELANTPIRHHKFPDVLVSPIFESALFSSPNSMVMQKDAIFPIGVKIDGQQIQNLINVSSLTQEQKDNIIGFKIVRGDRSTNKSIVAKGILRNVGKYNREGTEYYFPNYPYNDLSEDVFLLSQSNAYTSNTNITGVPGCRKFTITTTILEVSSPRFQVDYTNCYTNNSATTTSSTIGEVIEICSLTYPIISRGAAIVVEETNASSCSPSPLNGFNTDDSRYRHVFNSPETSFGQPFLGDILKIEDVIFGSGKAHFVQVKKNSLYKLLTKEAQEDALVSANNIANITSPYNASALFAAYQAYLTIYINGITRRNYGYSFNSIASYDYFSDVNNNSIDENGYTGIKQRNIDIAQYLIPGVQSAGDNNNINNYERESSVYIKTSNETKLLTKTYTTYRICNLNLVASTQVFQYTSPTLGLTTISITFSNCSIIDSFTLPTLLSGNNNYSLSPQGTGTITSSLPIPPLPFPNESTTFSALGVSDDSRWTLSEKNNCNTPGNEEDISVASYYGSIKEQFINQYGQIYSYDTIDTGFQKQLSPSLFEATVFGGDTFINKFAFKTKLPFFIDNRVGAPDDSDVYYDEIGNVAYPKYWYSSRSVLSDVVVNGVTLTNFISVKAHNLDCPNTQTPATSPGRTFYDGKMYLFAYGIPYFYCETSYNVDLRQAFNNKEGDFWPHVSTNIPDDWVQESYVSIANDNTYYYNVTYSKQNRENFFSHLPIDFTPNDCLTHFPFKAIYSDEQVTDPSNKVNNWLIYRALSYFDFPQNYGALISLDGVQNKTILARFENKSLLYNTLLTINTSNPKAAYLGNDTLFKASPPVDFAETDLGYVGSQHKFLLRIPQGQITIDAKRGQVFLLDTDAYGRPRANDLSAFGSGMNKFFTNHLPFEILKYFPEVNVDNNFIGIGLHGVYDAVYDRIIISKLDYIPLNNNIKYNSSTKEFYIEEHLTEPPVIKIIHVEDQDYFCNKSWTISYNINTKSWISFHSYIPNWYIAENNFFYSGLNDCCSTIEAIVAEPIPQPSTTTTSSTSTTTSSTSTTSTTTTRFIGCEFEGTATELYCDLYGTATEIIPTTTTTTTTQNPEQLSILAIDFYDDTSLNVCAYIDTFGVEESGNIVSAIGAQNFYESDDTAADAYMLSSDNMTPTPRATRRFEWNINKLHFEYPDQIAIPKFTLQCKGRAASADACTGIYALKFPSQHMTMTGSPGSYIPSVSPPGGPTPTVWNSNVVSGADGTVGVSVGNLILTFEYIRATNTLNVTTY